MADVSFAEWKKENVEIRKSRTFHYDYDKNNERITIKRDFTPNQSSHFSPQLVQRQNSH